MSNIVTPPLNLQEMLTEYRCGMRGLPTYEELIQIDIQMAVQSARVAALRQSLLTVLHEQAYIAQCFLIGGPPDVA
jgi:hypothetical protein